MKIKLKYLPTIILTLITASGGAVLLSSNAGAVDDDADAIVNVNTACVFDSDDYDYTKTFATTPGTYVDTESDSSKPTVHVTCNNINGFSIKAIGFSPDATHAAGYEGNTFMYGGTVGNINTGTSGTNSWWAFKVTSATATVPPSTTPTTVTPVSPYGSYAAIPSSATSILNYAGSTDGPVTGTMRTDYKINVSSTQSAGTYTGQVKYTIVGNV